MELFAKLYTSLLVLVYHCFDRIVIHGYLSGLSRPEQVVHFFRQVVGIPVVSKEVLSQRTDDYRNWVEAFARNHKIAIEWAEKGLRKEDHVLPALRRMEKRGAYGVYFIFKSMEQGRTFRITVPRYPTQDPNHRILAVQRSRFTHYYFYIRDEVLGPIIVRVARFFPFHATYWLNGHSFIQRELERAGIGKGCRDAVERLAVAVQADGTGRRFRGCAAAAHAIAFGTRTLIAVAEASPDRSACPACGSRSAAARCPRQSNPSRRSSVRASRSDLPSRGASGCARTRSSRSGCASG